MSQDTGTKSRLLSLLPGVAGTNQTLKYMGRMVRAGKKDTRLRHVAMALVAKLPPKSYRKEAQKIFIFVRDRIRYIKDITDVETLQTPLKTLQLGQGDCDDKSTLLATLLESIGHPTRFLVIGTNGKKYEHVLVQTKIGNVWVSLETTEPWEMGRLPAKITIAKVVRF